MSGTRFGEHQRLALARAFLRNAPVLILDESHQLCRHEDRSRHHRCVERPKKNRTTFMIGHCLSTLGGCDLLLWIDKRRELIKGTMEVSAIIKEELARAGLETGCSSVKANV
jgi:ABC-type multidrug transport system fused ATPase/permease subunit